MFSRDLPLCCLVVVGVALAAIPDAAAQLAAKSPFLPTPAAGAAAPAASAPIEYKGYMETSEGRLFRIYDPARKVQTWVKLNERNQEFGVLVKLHDSATGKLTLEHQGKEYTLDEPKPKVMASGAPPPMPLPAVASNVMPAVTQAVVLNPTPADEQRRLDAVAAEVQRRRALREQAAQQVPGANPQVVMPQPVQPQAQPQGNMQPGGQRFPIPGQVGAQPR